MLHFNDVGLCDHSWALKTEHIVMKVSLSMILSGNDGVVSHNKLHIQVCSHLLYQEKTVCRPKVVNRVRIEQEEDL